MSRNIFIVSFLSLCVCGCGFNNITIDDNWKTYFDQNKITGTFALYDNAHQNFTVYNLSRYKDSAYLPASTFKIVNSLIGLQTGVISSEKMIIKWDGIKRRNEDWNKDLTMEEAFRISAVPYYQEVARRTGKNTMQLWLDSLHYGNQKIGNRVDTFWLDNSLKITPDEELGFVRKLYFNQLPFENRAQDIVKKIMIQESNANYTLAYKTGLGYKENGKPLAWMVGWIEENKHPYFFVLNFDGANDEQIPVIRKNILYQILSSEGFLEGKK